MAAGSGALGGGVLVMTDDVKLLVLNSNLGYVRNKLMPSLTQRYLLVLAGGWMVQLAC